MEYRFSPDKGEVHIRPMKEEDYDDVKTLWLSIRHFGIRSVGDSKDSVLRFLKRNPGISVVAVSRGELIGTILCGHDGRTGCFYHVCVREDWRRQGVGRHMVRMAVEALNKEKISKISLFSFADNTLGNGFWKQLGFVRREDMYNYEWQLNLEDITNFNS